MSCPHVIPSSNALRICSFHPFVCAVILQGTDLRACFSTRTKSAQNACRALSTDISNGAKKPVNLSDMVAGRADSAEF